MLTALILTALVAGIVYASRRWPDIEARFFGVDKVDVPAEQTAEPVAKERTASGVKAHAKQAGKVAEKAVGHVTEFAGSLLGRNKSAASDTKDDKLPEDPATDDDPPMFTSKPLSGDEPDAEEADEAESTVDEIPEKEHSVPAAPSAVRAPGERVTSVPARPSQPAYHDSTRGSSENFEQLSSEADQAWRDREYERCEEACLKILVQQPKNIKYMTRIGQVYQQLGQLDDAKEAFEAAKKLDPKNFFVLNRLTEVERLLTDKKGRTQLNKVLKK